MTDRRDRQTWQTDVMDRWDRQMWQTDVKDRHDGQTWQTDMMDGHDGQIWWTDVTDGCDGWTWATYVTDRCDGWMWRTDVTGRRDVKGYRGKHCSWAGHKASAAINLNRPFCQTTNQMTFISTQPITWEKFILKKSFDMLGKSTFCSHFYLFKKVRTLFVVRTFYNNRKRIIRHCSCSHLFIRTFMREWKP